MRPLITEESRVVRAQMRRIARRTFVLRKCIVLRRGTGEGEEGENGGEWAWGREMGEYCALCSGNYRVLIL